MVRFDLNLFDLRERRIATLHYAWFAFFLTFVLWFNHAPLLVYIREAFALSEAQVRALLVLNVAAAIPARIAIGILIDRFGPRRLYTGLLVVSSLVCFAFAAAASFEQLALARFALGLVGAGFVIGIRLVSEWFPARKVGLAEGIYAGWGNFGSSAAAMLLPALALLFGGENGWRWATALTGLAALVFAAFFHAGVRDTPQGATYFRPRRNGALEVASRTDLGLYIAATVPLFLALGALAWRLGPANLGLLSSGATHAIWAGLVGLLALQVSQIYRVNRDMLRYGVPEIHRYRFKQVAILSLAYLVTFGSELAVVSMLPLYFLETFEGLGPVSAGLLASGYAFVNLVARPAGGWLSDRQGRRWTLQLLLLGLALGYFAMSRIGPDWPVGLAVLTTVLCAIAVNGGCGAVFAVVPLVQRRLTGQIAGMAGAYGNAGAVAYLMVLSFVDYSTFFLVIAASGVVVLGLLVYLDEPHGHMAELREDGSIERIEVA